MQRHQPPSELFQVHIPVVEDAGVETVLTNVASGALGGIAVGGVLAIQVHHEERDQMKVMGQQGVGGDPNLALFAERADEVREMMTVLVGGEYGLFVVAALDEMQPVTGWREAKTALHFALRR